MKQDEFGIFQSNMTNMARQHYQLGHRPHMFDAPYAEQGSGVHTGDLDPEVLAKIKFLSKEYR